MSPKKRTNEEWRELIAAWRASGQTQEEWCAANGVNLHTMRDRSSRLNKIDGKAKPRSKKPNPAPAGWAAVMPEKLPDKTPVIKIEYGGFSVTVTPGFDSGMLKEVLRTIKLICC